jgi:hypothetical protein
MPEDYAVAATRHFRDAALLEESRRVANADQLFGFAAECAIKQALVDLPGFRAGGTLAPAYHKHVNQLWDLVPLQNIPRRYGGLVVVLKGLRQPFADWSTDQRYGADGVVTGEAMGRHRRAAARILGSVGLNGTRGEA